MGNAERGGEDMFQNARRVLGVSDNADLSEIRRVYRRLARENHPDAGGDEERFKQINAAYLRLLSNPQSPVLASTPTEHRVTIVYGSHRAYSPKYLLLRRLLAPKITWQRGRVQASMPLVVALGLPIAGWCLNPTVTLVASAGFLALGQIRYSKY